MSSGVLISVVMVGPLKLCVLVVAGGRAVEQHGLGLEEREQPVYAALAADAGLLEAAVPHVEVGLEAVVADGAGPHLPGDLAGPLDAPGEHGALPPLDPALSHPHPLAL